MAQRKATMDAFIAALAKVAHPPQPVYKGLPEEMKPMMPAFITTKMARERIEETLPIAGHIFDMLAFFRADEIPFELIHLYFPFKPKEDIEKSLDLLENYALLNFRNKTHVDIHRMVQSVIIETLKMNSRILLVFTYFIRMSMKILREQTAHPLFNRFVYHILKSTEYLDAITNEKEHTTFKLMLADLVIDDHCFYYRTGKILQEALEETVKREGADHQEVLQIQVRQGHLKVNRENFDEAKILLEEILNKQIARFGEDHRDTLKTQFTIGRLFGEQRNFDEAHALLTEVHGKQAKIFGKTDKDAVKTMEWINQYIRSRDMYEKAAYNEQIVEELAKMQLELEGGKSEESQAEEDSSATN